LDSLRPDVLSYYKSQVSPFCYDLIAALDNHQENIYYNEKNVKVEKSECQDTTDFEKAMDMTAGDGAVVAIGAIGGRFDQTISCVNVLLKYQTREIYLVDGENLMFLLVQADTVGDKDNSKATGKYVIELDHEYEGTHCGLIPFGPFGKAQVETKGLKWDLNSLVPLQFGQLISTSNIALGSRIEVNVLTGSVIWTIEAKLSA
jgi:thiamine pyrophosphokinase